ncbi:hypothetical protein [Streptomyces sp. BH104]|uniref:hypothetical protein n=1 Tax=Streptomyces sp. BH104 TaxID=3410407 RepID=UPI003BB7CA41
MTTGPTDLLRQAETYLATLHEHAARHDNLGADFACAGCALRKRIAALPAEELAAPPAPAVTDVPRTRIAIDLNSRDSSDRVVAYLEDASGPVTVGATVTAFEAGDGIAVPARVVKVGPNGDVYLDADWHAAVDDTPSDTDLEESPAEFKSDAATLNLPADIGLRDRIVEALLTTPNEGWTYKPGHEKWDHHKHSTRPGHNYAIYCALCKGNVDVLADAVLAALPDSWGTFELRGDTEIRAAALQEAVDAIDAAISREQAADSDGGDWTPAANRRTGMYAASRIVRRMADEAQPDDRPAASGEGRRAVQIVLAETVAVYAASRLDMAPADVLDAAANAAAALRAPTRPAGWAEGRDWRADLLHKHAQEIRDADETQQAGESRG